MSASIPYKCIDVNSVKQINELIQVENHEEWKFLTMENRNEVDDEKYIIYVLVHKESLSHLMSGIAT